MAYFLKQATLKGRTYLSIVESFYSREKKGTAHKTYQSLGSIETHKAKGMDDPVSVFQKEVDELNSTHRAELERMISEKSPLLHLGYFPLKSIMGELSIKKYVDYFKLTSYPVRMGLRGTRLCIRRLRDECFKCFKCEKSNKNTLNT